jgi:hypothetical protein
VVQTVRATPLFFGRPWYDKVLVMGAPGRPNRYALVMALFWWEDKELALVQYFKEARRRAGDVLAADPWRCKPLIWATRQSVDGCHEPDVCVIAIESIVKSVYIAPDFFYIDAAKEAAMERVGEVAAEVERWHVSSFKHQRTVPDRRSLAPDLVGVQIPSNENANASSPQRHAALRHAESGEDDLRADEGAVMDWLPDGYDHDKGRHLFWEGMPD